MDPPSPFRRVILIDFESIVAKDEEAIRRYKDLGDKFRSVSRRNLEYNCYLMRLIFFF
jgi:hypothetical protein